ncbi:GPW/gp25 family protein [Thiocapsa marina]|uniref:GPW/gp25 family protein n=1 Tax=Thiocapsa marina 5811 TaxID=768671 RepID=F9U9K7_9GAMM|nr:GPW/gp25 family protein [Thiocapsa marina]EGV18805.1 GPW/gp25 family protein [Thiocapsa marina 5811]
MATGERPFLGRGWAFPPTFHRVGARVGLVEEEEDIRQSIGVLLSTVRGERLMLPEWGSGLSTFVFDTMGPNTLGQLRRDVEDTIILYEPRVVLERVDVEVDPGSQGELLIRIDYKVQGTNSRGNLVYPFYLDEATDQREF